MARSVTKPAGHLVSVGVAGQQAKPFDILGVFRIVPNEGQLQFTLQSDFGTSKKSAKL